MRRVYRALGPINWKWALGELTLIIAGVLTALAVNSWWESRNDAARERAYLRQLLVDVSANESAINDVVTAHTNSANAATRLASSFDAAGPLPSCDVLADLLQTALNWTELDLRTGTYSALLTTGDIRLIRNDTLRADVIRYAGVVDTVTAAFDRNESDAWGSAYTFRRRITYFWRLFEPRQPSDPPPWSGCNFEPLRSDPDIREALFSIHLLHDNRVGFAKELADANRALRSGLTSEVGVPSSSK
jgi:hypothetical protein